MTLATPEYVTKTRLSMNMTQERLGELLGYRRLAIIQMEAGTVPIRPVVYYAMEWIRVTGIR